MNQTPDNLNQNKMPVLFIGHGSPMNAIEDNEFTRTWAEIAQAIPRPQAILSISAHWFTEGTRVNDAEHPKMIYDMYGFPRKLYELKYEAKGAQELARETRALLERVVRVDNSWGIDHGTWSVLCKMYPNADIPVFQLSIDSSASPAEHFQMGEELQALRAAGVLILGSGNVVHNLSRVNWDMKGGYPWADEFDLYIKHAILDRAYEDIINYKRAGESAQLAFHTLEHFDPLLYVLGATDGDDVVSVYNDARVMGAMSMTSYLFTDKSTMPKGTKGRD